MNLVLEIEDTCGMNRGVCENNFYEPNRHQIFGLYRGKFICVKVLMCVFSF